MKVCGYNVVGIDPVYASKEEKEEKDQEFLLMWDRMKRQHAENRKAKEDENNKDILHK